MSNRLVSAKEFYLQTVNPQMSQAVRQLTLEMYPNVSFEEQHTNLPLAKCPVVMLVALTGTGKTTTLQALTTLNRHNGHQFATDIPSRRELADAILIPTAQVLQGEPVEIVKNREQRFSYTRYFAQNVSHGGTAEVFTWLQYRRTTDGFVLSEGVRGKREIKYALTHTDWRLVELWVDPVTRLQRLTGRRDTFDNGNGSIGYDLSFLPPEKRATVKELLASGDISTDALTTARAEAINYSSEPFDPTNQTPNYLCLNVDDQTPEDIARRIIDWVM